MTVSHFHTSYRPLIATILASYSHYFNQPASKSIIRFLYPAPISSFPNHALITNLSERFISICNALNCHIFQQCTGVISTFAILLRFDSYSAFSCRRAYYTHCHCFLWYIFKSTYTPKEACFLLLAYAIIKH